MTPKNKKPPTKPKPSIPSRAASALLAMGKTFSCTNIATISTYPKSRNNGNVPSANSNRETHHEAHDNNFYEDAAYERNSEPPYHQNNRQPLLDNEDLLLTVTELRLQLEHLRGVLEERDRIDAEKDKLIERLTNAVHNQSPLYDGNENRRRSLSGDTNLHLKFYKSELRFSAVKAQTVMNGGVVGFDDDDLV